MISFTVYGTPQPAGSKKGFVNPKTDRVVIVDDAKKSKPWKQQIAGTAREIVGDGSLFTGPLEVNLLFVMPRPKGHYGTGRNADQIKGSAPVWPTVKPDVDKLSRATLDALTGVVWRDDAQVVRKTQVKAYGPVPRVEVTVRELRELAA